MLGVHFEICVLNDPDCLCNTCSHDNSNSNGNGVDTSCCVKTDKEQCPMISCSFYERESTEEVKPAGRNICDKCAHEHLAINSATCSECCDGDMVNFKSIESEESEREGK